MHAAGCNRGSMAESPVSRKSNSDLLAESQNRTTTAREKLISISDLFRTRKTNWEVTFFFGFWRYRNVEEGTNCVLRS